MTFSSKVHILLFCNVFFFFLNNTQTTDIYTLSLHDALPIYPDLRPVREVAPLRGSLHGPVAPDGRDRKSTRLNSSHVEISYAVFCLKKKKTTCNFVSCSIL